jgi:signal transduction histidine kinase
MKLRTKILAAELPLIAILAAVSLYSVRTMSLLGALAENLVEDNLKSVIAVQRMGAELEAVEKEFVLDGDTALVASLSLHFEKFGKSLEVQKHNITEKGEQEATDALEASFRAWRERVEAAATRERRSFTYRTDVLPAAEVVRARLDKVLEINEDAMMRRSATTKRESAELSKALVVVSILALALASVVALVVAERIARPLTSLAESARRIGEGDLEVPLESAEGDDEVARLLREFRGMAEKIRAYRRSSLGELIEATEAARAAIDSLADPVITFHENGRFKRANDAARTMLGIDSEAPQPLSTLVPELKAAIERVRDRVLKGKGPQAPRGLENVIPILVAERPRYVQPIATPMYADVSGAVVGVTVLLRDVTSLRRADELKNDLLATVAHELRTPLTSIRMGIHLCLEEKVGPLTEKQQELLTSAREDAERLHRLVEGILSVSKIEAGVLVGRRRTVAPSKLVEQAVAPFRVRAADQRIALATRAPDMPFVEVDEDSVVLVLTNMLTNAFKHTPEGGRIEVTAEAADDTVRFNVTDTGGGIPEEHRPRLFEKFYRVPGSPPGGTGLGLSIARDIVFAHEGEIGVESTVGKGSRFWFYLPSRRPQSQSSEWPAVPGT